MILEPQVSPTLSPLPFHFRRYESLNHSCGSETFTIKTGLGRWKRDMQIWLALFLQFDYTTLNLVYSRVYRKRCCYSPINYDRRKVAKRIYEMLAMRGYVEIRKVQGDMYVTTTEKGDEICNQLLSELVTFARLSDIAPTLREADLSYEFYKVRKGASGKHLRENANLMMAARKLAEDILEINSHFKEEIRAIQD